jgi:alginate O-acetyltransferase complex protein AlgI
MLFNSFAFVIFFICVTAGYFALPHRWRWVLLLGASCYFYMYFIPKYMLVLATTIIVDYFAGIWISRSAGPRRKLLLLVSIGANVGFLGFFKYFNFFNDNLRGLAEALGLHYPIPILEIVLPVGLSFHTFQAMAYTIEVYRGAQKPETHLGLFGLYVMFYPQLVAGPIERPQNLLHQFREVHTFDYRRALSGLRLMGWGLFKKVVIADRLAEFVASVYDVPGASPGSALLGTIFFAFQIYCDFSGYSDIALGSARVMGFTLMKNFDDPYSSQSVGEFWKRWHVSLSTWFKDYVYIPLGGNRGSTTRLYANLLVTFLVSGLWHGANWTYIAWGALNGIYLVVSLASQPWRRSIVRLIRLDRAPRLHAGIRVVVTFGLACVAWVFFRAHSLPQAFQILSQFPRGLADLLAFPVAKAASVLGSVPKGWSVDGFMADFQRGYSAGYFLNSVAAVAFLELVQWGRRNAPGRHPWFETRLGGWTTALALVYGILILGAFTSNEQFIYFQF